MLGGILSIRGIGRIVNPVPSDVAHWTRYATPDGVFSVELPGTPMVTTKSTGGVKTHQVRYWLPGDAHYTLMYIFMGLPECAGSWTNLRWSPA